jgi:hypothetical protein
MAIATILLSHRKFRGEERGVDGPGEILEEAGMKGLFSKLFFFSAGWELFDWSRPIGGAGWRV